MSRTRAITLIEMLCCFAIIAIVMGISYPVFKSAVFSAKISSAQQNLRQHFIAISLYQSDQGESSHEGMPCEMGLPCLAVPDSLDYAARNMPAKSKWSPCGIVKDDGIPTVWWLYYRPFDESTWLGSLRHVGVGTRLMYDINCDFQGTDANDNYAKHRAYAVTLAGNIITKINVGSPSSDKFWGE